MLTGRIGDNGQVTDSYAARREDMAERLRVEGITDARVLAAMAEVPREAFVPSELQAEAYEDQPLPIGGGQTISTPWIVAFMSAALELSGHETALEVGAGSGYAAAVLSRCCHGVITVERHADLAEGARDVLSRLGYDNVEVRVGDGSAGAPDRAPYEAISVTAMASGEPPAALFDQLAPGGTLVCPVGEAGLGHLVRYRDGQSERLSPAGFVPLVEGNGS